jgi:hypothetical protein
MCFQFQLAPLHLVQSGIAPKFMARLKEATEAIPAGDPSQRQGITLVNFQLKVNAFCWLRASTFRLDVRTCCGLWWEVSKAKTYEVESKSGRLLIFYDQKRLSLS